MTADMSRQQRAGQARIDEPLLDICEYGLTAADAKNLDASSAGTRTITRDRAPVPRARACAGGAGPVARQGGGAEARERETAIIVMARASPPLDQTPKSVVQARHQHVVDLAAGLLGNVAVLVEERMPARIANEQHRIVGDVGLDVDLARAGGDDVRHVAGSVAVGGDRRDPRRHFLAGLVGRDLRPSASNTRPALANTPFMRSVV